MAKKVKFPLKMADDAQVRTLEELREHFDLTAVLGYYAGGKLKEWLEDRFYEDEAKKINALDSGSQDFKRQLCGILGAPYRESEAGNADLKEIAKKNERRERLKKFTADDKILSAVDSVVFTQEDLAGLLADKADPIYLCGDIFTIPGKFDRTYIGVNNPTVNLSGKDSANIVLRDVKKGTGNFMPDSVKTLTASANSGDAKAQFELGECYYNGEGVDQDFEEAVKWFREAAEQGNAHAQDMLGYCYSIGLGVDEDKEEAVKWYRKAAEQGHAYAQYNLGNCYFNGEGVDKDYKEAFKWHRKAVEQGFALAQYDLGNYYYYGRGVDKDEKEAVKWYRKAAEQGNADAQNKLGDFWAVDKEEAVEWYRKAAEQGNADAQIKLGNCYSLGWGVDKDKEEAVKWYRKAAEQGNADAQTKLRFTEAKKKDIKEIISGIIHAVGGKDNITSPRTFHGTHLTMTTGGVIISMDSGEIHFYLFNRYKVNKEVLSKFIATARLEIEYTKREESTGFFGKRYVDKDEGEGIVSFKLESININLSWKEEFISQLGDKCYFM